MDKEEYLYVQRLGRIELANNVREGLVPQDKIPIVAQRMAKDYLRLPGTHGGNERMLLFCGKSIAEIIEESASTSIP